MYEEVLSGILGGRDPMKMKVSEARCVIAEFYLEIELLTLGWGNRWAIDRGCEVALNRHGLGLLA